jgi:hypothetical protein
LAAPKAARDRAYALCVAQPKAFGDEDRDENGCSYSDER